MSPAGKTEPAAERAGRALLLLPGVRAPTPSFSPGRSRATTRKEENEEAAGRQRPAEGGGACVGERGRDEAYAGFKNGRVKRGAGPGTSGDQGREEQRESGPDRVFIYSYRYLGGWVCVLQMDRFSRVEHVFL